VRPEPRAVLTVVGSGTLLPDAGRGSAAFHVEAGGHRLLVDVGSGTLHGLPRAGIDWRALDTIAVSHFHPDHIVDLPALLAAYRFVQATEPLSLVGPPGFGDVLERMAALHGPWILEPSRPVEVVELEPGEVWWSDGGAVGLEATPTPHTDESVAYTVTCSEVAAGTNEVLPVRIGYTGDTGPSTELHGVLRGCHLLVAECALTDPPDIDTHLSPRSVAELALAAEPDLLLVSHVYPPRTPEEAVGRVARRYGGRVEAAVDGLRVHIFEEEVVVVEPPV
jgi:ribonuclease Z